MYLQSPSTLNDAIELAKRADVAIALSACIASQPNNNRIPMELGTAIANVCTEQVHKGFGKPLHGQARGRGNGCVVGRSTAAVVCNNSSTTGHFVRQCPQHHQKPPMVVSASMHPNPTAASTQSVIGN